MSLYILKFENDLGVELFNCIVFLILMLVGKSLVKNVSKILDLKD